MQRIEVKNFGPLKDVSIDVTNIVVLIGESASGKSTLAKLVYFFKTRIDSITDTILYKEDINTDNISEKTKACFEDYLLYYFNENYINGSTLNFYYNEYDYIEIKDGKLKDSKFLNDVIVKTKDIFLNLVIKKKTGKYNLVIYPDTKDLFRSLFSDQRENYYIPANRNLVSSFNEIFKSLFKGELSKKTLRDDKGGMFDEFIMNDFIDLCSLYADIFKNNIKASQIQKFKEYLIPAEKLFKNIIKGTYINENGSEYIEIENGNKISINQSSSGQQSSIRIMQDLFWGIESNQSNFRVIEEPESHLFPIAQKQLMEMIALFVNSSIHKDDSFNNQVIIPTHSPYILASFNNLMYAGKVGIENERINKSLWINLNQIRAYKLEGGFAEDIIDYELGLIRNEEIDEASSIINEEFDFIDNLQ